MGLDDGTTSGDHPLARPTAPVVEVWKELPWHPVRAGPKSMRMSTSMTMSLRTESKSDIEHVCSERWCI
jgi:hypothetical protein